MTADEFSKKYGKKAVRDVCEKVGISLIYWRNIKNMHCTVSSYRALELAKASAEVISESDEPMTVVDLLRMGDVPAHITGTGRG
jgi:predicted methyltransferase MtxX (methanogen marker protein 4)